MKNKILEVKNLFCGYNKKQKVLERLSFSIYEGEFIGLVGPNASGKTTFLKTILGIIKPLKGKIIKNRNLKFGYVPQIFTINETYPFSVYEILSFAFLKNFKLNLEIEDKQKIDDIIEKFNIKDLKFELYRNLSGGLKQKVLILRSLLKQPDILILDEPTNDLDLFNTKMVLEFIKNIKQDKNFAVIFASHNLETVLNYVDRLFLVYNGAIDIIDEVEDIDFLRKKISEVFKVDIKIHKIEDWKFIKV